MDFLKDVLRGVFIGVANVIPGVSGGTIALSMGIYEKILFAINHLKKDFKESIKTLLPYIIGVVIGILGLAFIIEFLLERYPVPTVFTFIGLIIGGLPPLGNRIKGYKVKLTHILSFILLLLAVIVPTILGSGIFGTEKSLESNFVSAGIMLLLGVLASASMVVPGVSGSMMLMILGYYGAVLQAVNIFVKSILSLDFGTAIDMVILLLPFVIGVILGIFIMAKLIDKLLKKYPLATVWGIIGLVVASAFAILSSNKEVFVGVSWITMLVSFVTFAVGFLIARKMSMENIKIPKNRKE